jgi:protein phosphatase
VVIAAAIAVVLVGGGTAAYAWTQNQYYVKPADGFVAIWRGVDQTLGPITLSRVDSVSDIPLGELPTYVQDILRAGTPIGSRSDADARVANLRLTADQCRLQAASGTPCGQVPVTVPTPSMTTTGTQTATDASITTGLTP